MVCGEWDVSIRRAGQLLEIDRSTYHYKSRRPGQADLKNRIKEICLTRVRYGCRRVHVLLRREGWSIKQKKTRRIDEKYSSGVGRLVELQVSGEDLALRLALRSVDAGRSSGRG